MVAGSGVPVTTTSAENVATTVPVVLSNKLLALRVNPGVKLLTPKAIASLVLYTPKLEVKVTLLTLLGSFEEELKLAEWPPLSPVRTAGILLTFPGSVKKKIKPPEWPALSPVKNTGKLLPKVPDR